MAKPISSNEEKAIIEAIKEGKKRNEIAREFKRSGQSITKIAKRNNLEFNRLITKKATEAKQYYSKRDRMNLLKQGFEKAAEMLRGAEAFRDLKDWSMAVAILIDKQRLEEGEPTEITKGKTENTNYHEVDLDQLPLEVVREIAKANNQRNTEKKPDTT